MTLEHQLYFYDDRNRKAAAEIFNNNGFEVRATETHEKQTRFWLLAVRSALVERVHEEAQRVAGFGRSYGGRYDGCNPRF